MSQVRIRRETHHVFGILGAVGYVPFRARAVFSWSPGDHGLQKDADVLGCQHSLVEDDGATRDFEIALHAPQNVVASADE
jgi:hypothetical protein